MRRRLWRQYAQQYVATWPRRARELGFWRKHIGAWRAGYEDAWPSAVAIVFEASVRLAELLGIGLAVAALDVLLWGGRYRALTASECGHDRAYFSDRLLSAAVLDEGSDMLAGRLRIAFVFGYVIKSSGTLSPPVRCHELAHVRQFERWGWAYVAKALVAQWGGAPYCYSVGAVAAGRALSAEQEAAHLEDRVRARHGLPMRHGRA